MRVKAAVFWAILCAALLAVQVYTGWKADGVSLGDLLLAEPKGLGSGGQSLKAVDQLREDGAVLTYEVPRAATVEGLRTGYAATVVGTNADYAGLMRYPILDGGFLTEAACEGRQRHAVLGEMAASRLFGTTGAVGNTLEMDGETWEVVGVVRDGEKEELRVYVPATIAGESPEAYLALMDEGNPEAQVRTELKKLGVQEDGYRIVNLSEVGAGFRERLAVSLMAGLAGLLLVLLKRCAGVAAAEYALCRREMGRVYARELFSGSRRQVARLALALALTAAGVVAMVLLSLQILEACLGWRETLEGFAELSARWFGAKIEVTRKWQQISLIVFFTNIFTYICLFFCLFTAGKPWYTVASTKTAEAT